MATTVGPYLKHGSGLVEACVATRTHYADLTGEAPFIYEMIRAHHTAAQEAGVKVVTCCGFDCVPCDLGVMVATRALRERHGDGDGDGGRAVAVKLLATSCLGGASGGTMDSIGEVGRWARRRPGRAAELADPYFLAPGLAPGSALRADTANTSKKGLGWDGDWGTLTVPWMMTPIDNALVRRSAVLRGDAHTYDEAMSLGAVARVAWFVGTHWGSFFDGWATPRRPRAGEGPTPEVIRDGSFAMRVLARGGGGAVAEVEVTGQGDPGYGATSALLAESALCLARGGGGGGGAGPAGGVLTPSTAMGTALVDRLEATGRFRFRVVGPAAKL